jgi:LysR family transcriptional activator of mexEF-oprN operon
MIAIVPDYIARSMAMIGGLRAEFAPLDLPQRELSMVWRGATHNDPGERWLRARCSAFLCEQDASLARLTPVDHFISAVA